MISDNEYKKESLELLLKISQQLDKLIQTTPAAVPEMAMKPAEKQHITVLDKRQARKELKRKCAQEQTKHLGTHFLNYLKFD